MTIQDTINKIKEATTDIRNWVIKKETETKRIKNNVFGNEDMLKIFEQLL